MSILKTLRERERERDLLAGFWPLAMLFLEKTIQPFKKQTSVVTSVCSEAKRKKKKNIPTSVLDRNVKNHKTASLIDSYSFSEHTRSVFFNTKLL